MSWKENLILHSFKNIYLEQNKEGKWKKKMNGLLPKWSEITKSKIINGDCGICCNTGKVSGVIVLDFDNIKIWEEWCEMFPILEKVPRVETRHGFHVYFEWNDEYISLPSKINNENKGEGNIDIQGNGKMVFYPNTTYKLEDGARDGTEFTYNWDDNEYEDLIELPNDLFKHLFSFNTNLFSFNTKINKPKIFIDSSFNTFNKKKPEEYAIVEMIDKKKYMGEGCYNDWIKIIWGLRNEGFEEEYAIEISNFEGSNFNENAFNKVWYASTDKKEIGMGTLKMYAKQSVGEETYYKILLKFLSPHIYYSTDDGLAQLALELIGDCFAWYNNNIMTYTNGRWYKDTELYYMRHLIGIKLKEYCCNACILISNNIKFLTCETKIAVLSTKKKEICNTELLIQKTASKNNIVKELKEKVINQFNKIDFDNNGYILAFQNCKYNFKTKKFESIVKEDYINMTTKYDWIEPKAEEVNKIKEILEKIFPNKEMLKCKLSLLLDCCIGKQKDNFEIDNGCGGNGKGIINGLMAYMLGDYFMNGNLVILTEKWGTGASPDVAVMDKKRLILFREPNSTDKIKLGNVKKLCDVPTISARHNYGDPFDVMLWGTLLMEVNKKLNFDGAVGDAERRRFIDLEYQSSFKKEGEYKLYSHLENVYQQDPILKTEEFKKTHVCALFKYIIDNAEKEVYIPDCVRERTNEYIDSQDDYLTWINSEYIYEKEPVNTKQHITLAKMFSHYKGSEEYEKLFKKDRPLSAQFKKDISTHSYFKMFYKERYKVSQGTDVKSALVGWRKKTNEEKGIEPNCDIESDDEIIDEMIE
jgi:phage/plasmid-associated DNA primase